MAPTLSELHRIALPNPTSPIMSSQSRIPSILRNNAGNSGQHMKSSFKFGSTSKIAVGKDGIELDIMTMAPPAGEQFMRSTCFEHLVNTLHDNRSCFTAAELTAALSSELPISTVTALETAHQACLPISSAPLQVSNLHLRGFRNCRGNDVKIKNDFLKNRPEDLLYAYFDCTIDPSQIDHRITQKPYSFSFCLRLPQTTQPAKPANPSNTKTKTNKNQHKGGRSRSGSTTSSQEAEEDISPTKTATYTAIFNAIEQADEITPLDPEKLKEQLLNLQQSHQRSHKDLMDATKPPDTPGATTATGTSTPPSVINATSSSISSSAPAAFNPLLSPKMNLFLGSNSSSLVSSYHGPLDFVDNQHSFNSIFGQNATLLHVNRHTTISAGESIEDTTLIPKLIHKFFSECKYDVFVSICRDDYVGTNFVPNNSQAIQEICSKIQYFKMEYNVGTTQKTCHPNDLYTKYLTLASSLPTDSTAWNIVLCTTFYNALSNDLRNKMLEEKFCIPSLHTLTTKATQLSALRHVKESAATAYTNMLNEEARINQLLQKRTGLKGGSVHFTQQPPQQFFSTTDNNYMQNATIQHDINHIQNGPPSTSLQPAQTGNVYAYQSASQAESTLQKYSNPPSTSQSSSQAGQKRPQPPLITKNGVQYPYDPENPNNVSEFPLGFRGCFGCGHKDHFDFRRCPFRAVPGMSTQFWRNLWLHKPHTKKSNDPIPDTPRPFSIPHTDTASSNDLSQYTNPAGNINIQGANIPPQTTSSNNNQQQEAMQGHGLGRGSAATKPAWMSNNDQLQGNAQGPAPASNQHDAPMFKTEEGVSKQSRLFLTSAKIFSQSANQLMRPIPLDIDNGLPQIQVRFGNTTASLEEHISFSCHVDSCAAMNTGNLLVHKWVATKHPEIVVEFIEYNDPNPFQPLQLLCALKGTGSTDKHTQAEIDVANSLTAIVRYRTPYTYQSTGKQCILSFGLGENVSVNSILGLPQLKAWQADVLFRSKWLQAHDLGLTFHLEYQAAQAGLPNGVTFTPEQYIRPVSGPNVPQFSNNNRDNSNHSSTSLTSHGLAQVPTTVTDSSVNGYTIRSVTFNGADE